MSGPNIENSLLHGARPGQSLPAIRDSFFGGINFLSKRFPRLLLLDFFWRERDIRATIHHSLPMVPAGEPVATQSAKSQPSNQAKFPDRPVALRNCATLRSRRSNGHADIHWIRRYVYFHQKIHAMDVGNVAVSAFRTPLAYKFK